jgi:hypothetical protein
VDYSTPAAKEILSKSVKEGSRAVERNDMRFMSFESQEFHEMWRYPQKRNNSNSMLSLPNNLSSM